MTPRTLSDSLLDYYDARKPSYSASTWKAHEGQLERMRGWLVKEMGPHLLLTDPDERVMLRYFNGLRPPFKSARSYNNYRNYCAMFFRWCKEEGWLERNPMRHVDAAKVPKKKRLQLSAAELLASLETASPRDRIALALGMNTGLRGGDITVLHVGDVNLTNDELTAWVEKTDQAEDMAITPELRVELIRWLHHYAEATGHTIESLPNDYVLVPSARFQAVNVSRPDLGGKVAYKTDGRYRHPEQIVQRALALMGHPTKGEGFHTLRRSAARVLFNQAAEDGVGDPIRIPQSLLGHKNRATTEIYLGITHEKRLRDDLMRGKGFLTRQADSDRAKTAGEGKDTGEAENAALRAAGDAGNRIERTG